MARRAHGDSAQTFDAIVAAAKKVLADDGATGLSLRRVAQVAELSLGTVQYYFSSKDKLVATCLDDQAESLWDDLQVAAAAMAAGANIEDLLAAGVSGIYRRGLETRETLRLRVMKALETQDFSAEAPWPYLPGQLQAVAKLLSEHTTIELADAGMLVLSTSLLVTRYSIYSATELRSLLDLTGDDDAVYDAVDAHLQLFTRALFRQLSAEEDP